jgi:hypothetical protein
MTDQSAIDRRGRIHFQHCKEKDSRVASYTPSLLLYMNCHIHVDICFTVTVFMFLYKYLFKGPDQTRFRFETTADESSTAVVDDEFREYISGRYLLSSKAVYRIFSFNLTSKRPLVRCLLVHLEHTQPCQMKQRRGDEQSFMFDLLLYSTGRANQCLTT